MAEDQFGNDATPVVPCRALGLLMAGLMAVSPGCAEGSRSGYPTANLEPAASAAQAAPAAMPGVADGVADGQDISVARLVAIAREHTPTQALLHADRAAAAAAVTQAGAFANPELEIEGGQGRARSGEGTEATARIALRQRLEFPGKRSSRIAAADAVRGVVEGDGALLDLDVEVGVRAAAVDLASASLSVQQAKNAADIAHRVAELVQRHVAAGESNRGDALRVELDQRQAAIELDQRERTLVAAREALRARCAGRLPSHFTVTDGLTVPDPPSLDDALAATDRHPKLARLRALRLQRQAELRREDVAGRPDPTIGAFAGRGIDGTEIGLSLGLDLPLWNRNQGGILTAEAGLGRTEAEAEAAARDVRSAIDAAWHTAAAAISRRDRLASEIQPLAAELLSRRIAAFSAGEVALSDALDARRTAQATDQALDESRADAARALIRLREAMGTFGPALPHPTPEPVP